jgi:hypothetical protein
MSENDPQPLPPPPEALKSTIYDVSQVGRAGRTAGLNRHFGFEFAVFFPKTG